MRTQDPSPATSGLGDDGFVDGSEVLQAVLPFAQAGWLLTMARP